MRVIYRVDWIHRCSFAATKQKIMVIDKLYTKEQIESQGLNYKEVKDIDTKIYTMGDKVYFFESVNGIQMRLFTVISKKSFFI